MTNETAEKKRTPSTTMIASFPVGDATAIVRIKGDREPNDDDFRHAAAACDELAAVLRKRLPDGSK